MVGEGEGAYSEMMEKEQTESSGFRRRVPTQGMTKSFRSRFDDVDCEDIEDETSRPSSIGQSRSRNRHSRIRQSRGETSELDDHRSGQCSVVLIWSLESHSEI